MKKLFSLKELMTQSQTTLSRFPMTFVFALLSAVMAIVLIENEIEEPWLVHVNVLLSLGLPLFTALHVWLENLAISSLKKQLILTGGGKRHQVLTPYVTKIILGDKVDYKLEQEVKKHPCGAVRVKVQWLIDLLIDTNK